MANKEGSSYLDRKITEAEKLLKKMQKFPLMPPHVDIIEGLIGEELFTGNEINKKERIQKVTKGVISLAAPRVVRRMYDVVKVASALEKEIRTIEKKNVIKNESPKTNVKK